MNKKRGVILAGFIFLFLMLLINFASAAEGCESNADCNVGAGEVCNLNSFKCQDAALVGSWDFEDGTARDSSVNMKDGVLFGDAYITPERTLKMGGAGYMDIPSANDAFRAPIEGAQEYTVAFKVKVAPGNLDNAGLVTWYSPFDLTLRSGNLFSYWDHRGYMLYDTPLLENTWYFVAVTYKTNGQNKIYIDGKLVASKSAPYPLAFSNTPFNIGNDYTGGAKFKGEMDDILFYNRQLTSDEIKEIAGVPLLPSGISSVTGTVGVTASGTGDFGDILTVTGGTSGGEINIIDSANVLTTKISVPANTETSLSINSAGEQTIFSTIAISSNPLKFENLKSSILNFYLRKQNEAILRLRGGQKLEIFEQEGAFGIKSSATNNQDVQFSISSGASSDCDTTTCTSLGGHCVGNWCMPGTEIADAFSTGKTSISGKLSPDESIGFKSSQAISGQHIFNLKTSRLTYNLEFRKRDEVFVKLNMLSDSGIDFVEDSEKGLAFIVPSGNIELTSLASQAGMTFYSMKVRKLRQGQLSVATPANYKFDANGDGISDVEYNSKMGNYFFSKVFGSGYDQLSQTRANGINLAVFSSSTNRAPTATVTHNELSITKNIGESETFNFIAQMGKLGNEVTVKGNSREILGSLIEEVSPEAIIEGWNYWYTATDDNYWQWSVILESLPTGCTADKTSASTTVANGVQTLAFYVDCGTATSTTGSVISGFATNNGRENKQVGFATKGRAQLLSSFADCTKETPSGQVCKPSQKFTDNPEVVKGIMNPIRMTGSSIEGVGGSGGLALLISLLTLAGIIVLIVIQINRKTVNW